MREHGRLRVVVAERQTQQLVGHDGLTDGTRVVAQLTDLGRRLVDEAQVPVAQTHRGRPEQTVGCALGELGAHRGSLEVEPVALDGHVHARGVTAAHLQPVERGQRDLDRRARLDRRNRRFGPRQLRHRPRGTEAIVAHGPHRVLQLLE